MRVRASHLALFMHELRACMHAAWCRRVARAPTCSSNTNQPEKFVATCGTLSPKKIRSSFHESSGSWVRLLFEKSIGYRPWYAMRQPHVRSLVSRTTISFSAAPTVPHSSQYTNRKLQPRSTPSPTGREECSACGLGSSPTLPARSW